MPPGSARRGALLFWSYAPTPAFAGAGLDAVEALSPEREALWARLEKASFLTRDEKRAAVGYGPLGDAEAEGSAGVAAKANFNPAQLRVPAGNPDGGQWTDGGGGGGSTRPQPASRVRPPPRPPRGPGDNNPPASAPRSGTGTPSPPPFDGRTAIEAYRDINNFPRRDDSFDDNTVAYAEVGGSPFFGVNSRAPGYTEADRAAADQMRDTLTAKYPEVLKIDNIGQNRMTPFITPRLPRSCERRDLMEALFPVARSRCRLTDGSAAAAKGYCH